MSKPNFIRDASGAVRAIIRGIIGRRSAEVQLKEAEERWQLALRSSRDGIWDWNFRSKKIFYSARWREMFGYTEDEEIDIKPEDWEQFYHPDDRHVARKIAIQVAAGEAQFFDMEFRHLCKDGTYKWVQSRGQCIQGKKGLGLARLIGLHTDISERKRAESERRVISEIIQGVTATSNLDDLLALIHRSLSEVVYAKNCYVALYDKNTGLFSMPFFVDEFDEVPQPAEFLKTRTRYVFKTETPLLMTTENSQRLMAQGEIDLVGTPPKCWLGTPLRTPSEVIGVLVVQSYEDENAYSERDLEFLRSVGDQVAFAIERKRAELALEESRDYLDRIINAIADPIFVNDRHHRMVMVNNAFLRFTNRTRQEVIGKSAADLCRPDEARVILEMDDKVFESEKDTINEEQFTDRDGNHKVMLTRKTIWTAQDGQKYLVGIIRDITERKKAEEALRASEEQHRLLFETNPQPAFVYDLETFEFLAVNEAAVRHYGYSKDEFLGTLTVKDIRPPEDLSIFLEKVSKVAPERDIILAPSRHRKKDGTVIDVEITSHVLEFAGRRAEIVLVNDVTERKHAEQQLKIFNEKLQQSNRELQDFAYVASHDLQEPLRKVQTFADRLSSKYADALEGSGLDYLERMRSAAHRMQTLIQDLLSFSRVTTKAQPFVPVNLEEVTRDVLSDLEIGIETAGATVELNDLPTVDADPSQMRQLIQNLVGNAIKFRRSDTAPVVRITGQTSGSNGNGNGNGSNGHYCKITVEDNGIGFDEKYLDKIFTVFQRLHGRVEYEGSGIGLAVCRKIVERHHGTITAQSSPDKGAKFIVTLPVKQTTAGSDQ